MGRSLDASFEPVLSGKVYDPCLGPFRNYFRSNHAAFATDPFQLHQLGQELNMIQALGRAMARHFIVFPQEGCQRRSKISPPGRSKTSPLNVMRYAVLGGLSR